MPKEYVKHLIECKCILPILDHVDPPIFHQFVVFSELEDETANVIPSYAQCTNCGVIHHVTEVGESTILKKEESMAIPTKEDIELELPEKLVKILSRYDAELHIWQEARFIIENELWGRFLVLSREHEGNKVLGKILVIHGKTLYKVEPYEMTAGLI